MHFLWNQRTAGVEEHAGPKKIKLNNSGAASRCGRLRSAKRGLRIVPSPAAKLRPKSCVYRVIGMNTLNNCGAASHWSQLRSPLGGLAAEEGGEVEESSKWSALASILPVTNSCDIN